MCSLLSCHSYMFDDDAPILFKTMDELHDLPDIYLRPIVVNPGDINPYFRVPRNLIFFDRESLERNLKDDIIGFCDVGFPPLDAKASGPNLPSSLNILPEKASNYLRGATPVGAAIIANAVLATIARKYDNHENAVESMDRKDCIRSPLSNDAPLDVLNVYNVPATKALCDTIGFQVDTEKFGSSTEKVVTAYFKIPKILGAYGELLMEYCKEDRRLNKADLGPCPQYGDPVEHPDNLPISLPLVSKLLPAALEFKFKIHDYCRICWVGYHNGVFFERLDDLSSIELGKFKIQDYRAPLIGVDAASSFKYDADITAELVGRPNLTNAGFLVARSIFDNSKKVCLGISTLRGAGPTMSHDTIPVEKANIVALPCTSTRDSPWTSYPKAIFVVIMSRLFDALSLVGAIALLLLALHKNSPKNITFLVVAIIELAAEVLTRITLLCIIRKRLLKEWVAAFFSPIDFTLREDPQEIPAKLWRKPLTLEGFLGFLSALLVVAMIAEDNKNTLGLKLTSALPSFLVLLMTIGRTQLISAFINLFNYCEETLVGWEKVGPFFLLSYLMSLLTEIILLIRQDVSQNQNQKILWIIALVATVGNVAETVIAIYALAPISTAENSDYGSTLITGDYHSHLFRGTLGYIPLAKRIPVAKRKWATVRKINENSGKGFCTIFFVDEENLKNLTSSDEKPRAEEDEDLESEGQNSDQKLRAEKHEDLESEGKPDDPMHVLPLTHTVPLGCSVALLGISYKNAPTVDLPFFTVRVREDDSEPKTNRAYLRAITKQQKHPNYQKHGIYLLNVEVKPKPNSAYQERHASMYQDGRLVL
mmetsp:Transcript_29227/g.44190  ORF Transcript_29227/g.44190 Transcript_29227/m.44190 type:complete len:821 (+) Transcript_29227:760-3222(+)